MIVILLNLVFDVDFGVWCCFCGYAVFVVWVV